MPTDSGVIFYAEDDPTVRYSWWARDVLPLEDADGQIELPPL